MANKFKCLNCNEEFDEDIKVCPKCNGKVSKILDLKGGTFNQTHFFGEYDKTTRIGR